MHKTHNWTLRFAATFLMLAGLFALCGTSSKAATTEDLRRLNYVYDFGTAGTYSVTEPLAMTMMQTDANGNPIVTNGHYHPDPLKVRYFLVSLDLLYRECPDRKLPAGTLFTSTNGKVIDLGANYPMIRTMAYEAEAAQLMQAMENGVQSVHKPVYYSAPETYIEIDKGAQALYLYDHHVLQVATPIVTGTLGRMDTPDGCYRILSKARSITLRGGGRNGVAAYASYVNYWMAFIGSSIGIHDATWRSSFGGSIYTRSGSHGCVNVPLEVMDDLYALTPNGTPVIVFP